MPDLSLESLGLCGDCRHRREVRSAKGSMFHLCALSESDRAYPRYPRLPVVVCKGHEPPAPHGPHVNPGPST